MTDRLKITFLGTGTSQGVPVIACPCPVCHSKDSKDKRLRSAILIEKRNTTVIIDTGPDFRYQMLRAGVKKLDAVLLTHQHKDHTAGLDDIRAFNYLQKKAMPVYCEKHVWDSLYNEFAYIFAENKYPGIPEIDPHMITDNDFFQIGAMKFRTIRVTHKELPVLGFRTDDFAYITDANVIPESEMEKLKGLKVLVINALRKKKHISHFTLSEALAIIKILKPKKAYLTHISHSMGFHRKITKELPDNVELAYDKLSFLL